MKSTPIKIKLLLLALFTVPLAFALSAASNLYIVNNASGEIQSTESKTASDKGWTIISKVAEARVILKNSSPLSVTRGAGNKITEKEISFALLDIQTGKIAEKRVWFNVGDANKSNFQRRDGISLRQDPSGPQVINEVWNSFNSEYSVSPNNYIVIANKYLMPSSSVFDPTEKSKADVSEIIYAPYSRYVHTPETVKAGAEYLQKIMSDVRQSLENVPSHFMPAKSVADAVSEEFPYYIALIEHIDPDSFLSQGLPQKQELIERVLVRYGLNGDYAYKYTGSPAGAWGPAQFTKPTYNAMNRLYPDARLITDFKQGVIDTENTFKAMFVLFDHLKWDFGDLVREHNISESMLEEMVASGYNGNPARVARSFKAFGLGWIENQLTQNYKNLLMLETKKYVLKLRELKNLPIFGSS